MDSTPYFNPPRRRGLILHAAAGLLALTGSGVSVWQALRQESSGFYILLLLLAFGLLLPAGQAIYRWYALLRGHYLLERDGLRLRWGLRGEDIPLDEVEWVRPAGELGFDLPLPFLAVPGAILGSVAVPDYGLVEYLASEVDCLIVVATPKRLFAISPEDPGRFMRMFRQATEMGSLAPIQAQSTRSVAYLRQIWNDRVARGLLVTAGACTLVLLAGVSVVIPGRESVILGNPPPGVELAPVSADRLLLLPAVGVLIFLIDLLGGLFFYRKAEERLVAYLLWISGVLTPLLLMVSALLVLFRS
jgi:hypothetical protein